jgi:5,10-methylene-tetrahydrofolate dehydrogenase/methenyl tetrahydrofolate cyclohydrolase
VLGSIIVGDNSESEMYVRMKHKACDEIGIEFLHYDLEKSVSEDDLSK